MKRVIKNNLIGFVIGGIIFGSIGVYATVQYTASQITYNKNGQATVDAALNDLYNKKNSSNILSGEAFLITASKGLRVVHNYNPYGAYLHIENLDFSNIKDFTYSYSLTTSDTSYQELKLIKTDNTLIMNTNTSVSNQKVTINGESNLKFLEGVANNNTGIFTVSSYTRMDGTVVNFE